MWKLLGVDFRENIKNWVLAALYLRCPRDSQIEVPSVLLARSRLETSKGWRLVFTHCVQP